MKKFTFDITCSVVLTVENIWPDGDAPEDPTVDDVLKVIEKCGGARNVLRNWGLDDDLELTVNGEIAL